MRLGAAFVAVAALAVVVPAGGAPGERPSPPEGPLLLDEESSSRHEGRVPPAPPIRPEIPPPAALPSAGPLSDEIEEATPPERARARGPTIGHPLAMPAVQHDVSPPLRFLRGPLQPTPRPLEIIQKHLPSRPIPPGRAVERLDPVLDTSTALKIPSPVQTFDGLSNADNQSVLKFRVLPPDPNGDVGRDHYVQWVNLTIAVYDKSGNIAPTFPKAGNALWSGFGGLCQTTNEGDPIVLYDSQADRWFLSQFAFDTLLNGTPMDPFFLCVAVSTTGDPTGTYNRYAFEIPNDTLPDYPKWGVWRDAFLGTTVEFNMPSGTFAGTGAIALDRAAMIAGTAAVGVYFDLSTAFRGVLPADLDGLRPPPPGSPGYFMRFADDPADVNDQLRLYELDPDFTTPASSTFTLSATLPTAAFESDIAGGSADAIPQPETTEKLDAIADRLMHRLAYRNFGTHESLVVNHTVDANGLDRAGIRWYEIRDPGGTPAIFQQGTYSPDADHRWMGSIAMDGDGNIAVGYSVSSGTVFPSIRYAGRLTTDPLGTLAQGEATLQAGGGSQTHTASRWGDYSMMTVDPVDDCTFWFTSEYYSATSSSDWKTRIGKFEFTECTPPPSCDGQTATHLGTDGNDVITASISDDVVIAGDGNDQVVGGDGNDRICGGNGNDVLQGNAGDDVLLGGLGNDALNGGADNDNMDGGAGHDSIRGSNGDDTGTGGTGVDWYTFSDATAGVTASLMTGTATGQGTDTLSGIEHLLGSAFNDTFTGDDQPNILRGEGGTDTLVGNGGPDQLLGGAGDDNATLDGGPGNDFLSGGDGVDKLLGGPGNDELQGGPGDDGGTTGGLDGGSGNDRLYGGAGDDKLAGGSDNDALDGGSENDELDGGTGHDTLKGGAGNDILTGGDQADWATFGTSPGPVTANLVTGTATGDGTDTLSGIEFLLGSPFDDTLTGDDQPNILWGEGGSDTLTGGGGPDQLLGGAGDDPSLNGGPGDDFLSGGDGVDKLLGGDGNDELQGGAGDDGGTTGGLEGGAGDDVLFGDDGADALSGGDGNDALNGGADNDSLDGDAGLDTLRGGPGNDDLDGGPDGDWVTYSEASGPVTVDLSATPATGAGGDAGADTIANIGAVQGSAFGDTITGDDQANILLGEGGADSLFGNGGGDQVDGGPDDDVVLNGGDGDDFLDAGLGTTAAVTPVIGGAGDDFMVGGSGSESFDGGSGDDIIVPFGGPDTIVGGAGLDMLSYEPSPAAVSVNLELGTVANDGYGFADTVPQTGGLSTIEILIGSAFDDVLVGDIGPNEIHGLAGDDFLDGRAGFDFLDGGAHVVGDECVNGEALFDCEL